MYMCGTETLTLIRYILFKTLFSFETIKFGQRNFQVAQPKWATGSFCCGYR